jgi:hypothetical protein
MKQQKDVISYGSSISCPEKLAQRPIGKLMEHMKNGGWKDEIEAIRAEEDPQRQKEMKLRLPWFAYAVIEGKRAEDNVRQANGIVFDFDDVADDDLFKIRGLMVPWIKWMFRSPIGGVKAVVPFSRPVTDKEEYTRIWHHLREETESRLGFKADNTPDMSRACFVSWDEDFVESPHAEEFDVDAFLGKDRFPQIDAEKNADPADKRKERIDQDENPKYQICEDPRFSSAKICGKQGNSGEETTPTEVSALSAVKHLCGIKLPWRDWTRCGMALYNHFGEEGKKYWMMFADNPNYQDTPTELSRRWEGLKKYPSVNIATLFWVAEQNGWINALAEDFSQNRETESQRSEGAANSALPQGSRSPSGNESDCVRSPNRSSASQYAEKTYQNRETESQRKNVQADEGTGTSKTLSLCPSALSEKTLDDFPELLELFRRPENVPLDLERLPEVIRSYLELVGRITDAQDGAKLTAFLPVVAANIGNRCYMYNAGTKHFCNIWAAIIGPSTVSRKTTVINQAMKMLKPFKIGLLELSAKERNERDIELSRVTQARMYNLLAINPNRLLLHMELSAWMQEMNKAYNAGMKQEITDMFDGKDRSIAKMEIDEYIRRPAFSIVGATTEDWFFRELREIADQRGGFLQRFIICIIQNIDVAELRFEAMHSDEFDAELHAWDDALSVFRSLPDTRQLFAGDDAQEFRDAIYRELMQNIALNANDPQAAYCARIFDNYFWRFCILIFLLKNWRDIREARDNDHLESWFFKNKVDLQTAKEAWYLCEYYFQNTQPFLKSLSENAKLDNEKKIVRILQRAEDQKLSHSRLLCKSKLTSREFRACIESLIERQAVVAHDRVANNRLRAFEYSLNPVLSDVELT